MKIHGSSDYHSRKWKELTSLSVGEYLNELSSISRILFNNIGNRSSIHPKVQKILKVFILRENSNPYSLYDKVKRSKRLVIPRVGNGGRGGKRYGCKMQAQGACDETEIFKWDNTDWDN